MCKMLAPPPACLSSANSPSAGILAIANSAQVNSHSRHRVFKKWRTLSVVPTSTIAIAHVLPANEASANRRPSCHRHGFESVLLRASDDVSLAD